VGWWVVGVSGDMAGGGCPVSAPAHCPFPIIDPCILLQLPRICSTLQCVDATPTHLQHCNHPAPTKLRHTTQQPQKRSSQQSAAPRASSHPASAPPTQHHPHGLLSKFLWVLHDVLHEEELVERHLAACGCQTPHDEEVIR